MFTCSFVSSTQVCWSPYGVNVVSTCPRTLYYGLIRCHSIIEPYASDRVTRQFGFVQTIPADLPPPDRVHRPADARFYDVGHPPTTASWSWHYFSRVALRVAELIPAIDPWADTPDYVPWFRTVSHPIIQNPGNEDVNPVEPPSYGSAEWVQLFFRIVFILPFCLP